MGMWRESFCSPRHSFSSFSVNFSMGNGSDRSDPSTHVDRSKISTSPGKFEKLTGKVLFPSQVHTRPRALQLTNVTELKLLAPLRRGIDMLRRLWSSYCKDLGKSLGTIVFEGDPNSTGTYLAVCRSLVRFLTAVFADEKLFLLH